MFVSAVWRLEFGQKSPCIVLSGMEVSDARNGPTVQEKKTKKSKQKKGMRNGVTKMVRRKETVWLLGQCQFKLGTVGIRLVEHPCRMPPHIDLLPDSSTLRLLSIPQTLDDTHFYSHAPWAPQ